MQTYSATPPLLRYAGSAETRACKVIKQRDTNNPLVLQACSVMCLDALEIQFKHKIDQAIPMFRLNGKL